MEVGMVGCGRVAHIHMNAYKRLRNVNVVAVSDADLNRAKAFAAPYKIGKTFSNYADLFEMKDLDLVDICTPTSTHESIVCDAAKSGLNVLVEKPMGRNSKECEKMIEESRKHGGKLCVSHSFLFFPYVRQLKAIADSNGFDLTSFRTSHKENFEWLRSHALAQPWNVSPEHGGILWEVGTHLAYIQLHFLDDDIREVYALGAKTKYPVWDDFIVLLRTSSQRWGIMEISWVAQESEIVYEITSSEGRTFQTYLFHGYTIERTEEKASNWTGVLHNYYTDQKRLFTKWMKFAADQVRALPSGHLGLISSYIESLEKGKPPPVSGEDGRNAVRLLECIDESLTEKRPVSFSSW